MPPEPEEKVEQESLDDMYSDIDDNEPLNPDIKPVENTGKVDFSDIMGEDNKYSDKISDLVKQIEEKREREKAEKQKRDIKPATVEDYFKGFSSTIHKKIVNEKKIRSVMEESIAKDMTAAQEAVEIKRRFAADDDYMECFPTFQDTSIQAFDETDFAKKVKESYYDEELIKKDEEWMKADRTFIKGGTGQKFTQDDIKKRDVKDMRKADKKAVEVDDYLASKN